MKWTDDDVVCAIGLGVYFAWTVALMIYTVTN